MIQSPNRLLFGMEIQATATISYLLITWKGQRLSNCKSPTYHMDIKCKI